MSYICDDKLVILGAGGAIGHDLAKELTKYTQNIRLYIRNNNGIYYLER